VARLDPATLEFLARLVRLEPGSLVRLRGAELWSRVPWNVLVTVPALVPAGDITVSAAAWLALGVDDPSTLERLDAQWRAGLPAGPIVVREVMPLQVVRRMSEAAAATLRETESSGLRGRAVGARVLRDALLDHVPIIVAADADHASDVRVSQRLVQAVARMGLLTEMSGKETARVVTTGPWVGISTDRGSAWWRAQSGLAVNTGISTHRA
jgi:hypothetical protein